MGGGQDFVLLAKAGLAIPEDQLDYLVEKTITSKKADFFLIVLTRVMALAPGQYDEQVKRAAKELPGLWMSKGDELGVFWSENHFLMWHSCSMILAQFGIPLPEGWRERIVFYLQDKIDVGFYEFSSLTYYPFSLAGLLNLYDFAPDNEIKELASRKESDSSPFEGICPFHYSRWLLPSCKWEDPKSRFLYD